MSGVYQQRHGNAQRQRCHKDCLCRCSVRPAHRRVPTRDLLRP